MMTKEERSVYNHKNYLTNKEKISKYKKKWYLENRCNDISRRKRQERYQLEKVQIQKMRREKRKNKIDKQD